MDIFLLDYPHHLTGLVQLARLCESDIRSQRTPEGREANNPAHDDQGNPDYVPLIHSDDLR
jgi:hypothetical protein